MSESYQRTDIMNIAGGAVAEHFKDQLLRVMANVDDLNTEAKATRKITIEIEFTPDGSRQALEVYATVKTKLAGPKAAESIVFVVRDGSGEVFPVNSNPNQPELFKS